MQSLSTITVAIPTYNRCKSVLNLINQLIPQLDESDEILVLDDASQDGTADSISCMPRVRLVSNSTNQGMVKNWNKCLQLASHTWICMIHDDDLVTDETVKTIKKMISKVDEPMIIMHDSSPSNEPDQNCRYRVIEPGVWSVLNSARTPSGVTIHKEIFDSIGGFNEEFTYSTDIEYFARVCSIYAAVVIESPRILNFSLHSQNYEYETWSKSDFLKQLENIEKLVISYSNVREEVALSLFRKRMNSHIHHMLGCSPMSDNEFLLRQVGRTVSQKRYLSKKNLIKSYVASFLNWIPNL